MKKIKLLLIILTVSTLPCQGQKTIESETAGTWQNLFRGIITKDSLLIDKALKEGADINQAVNGITPMTFLSTIMSEDDEFLQKRKLFNYLIKKGANYKLGYTDALKHSAIISKQPYDKDYEWKTYSDLDFSIPKDSEVALRSALNNSKIALIYLSYILNPPKSTNAVQKEANLIKVDEIKSRLGGDFINLDEKLLKGNISNLNALDVIYLGKVQKHFVFPKVKKQFIELIEKNDVEGFKKLYQKYPLPFASKHNPDADYVIFNNGPYRLIPSKEIVEFAIKNGFDVNARIGDDKYGRLIENVYNNKGKDYLPGEPKFEFFKSIYEMCLDAGLDMNFTYEDDTYIKGLILDIIKRGNEDLFNMIPKGQLKPNFYFLRFALSDNNNPLLDKVLEIPFEPEQITQGIFRLIDYQFNTPNIHTLEKLLKKGADLNILKKGVDEQSHKEYTVVSAILENKEITDKLTYIKLLEKYGADINQPDIESYGKKEPHSNPFYHIMKMNNTPEKLKLLDYFIEKGAYPISGLYKFDSKEDILECALIGPTENIGLVIDFLLDENIAITQSAIDRISGMIKPKKCKTCKKRPELKPYLKKMQERIK